MAAAALGAMFGGGGEKMKFSELLEHNQALPVAFDTEAKRGRSTTALALTLTSIEGAPVKLVPGSTAQIRVQLSLFDCASRQFFGKTWIGPMVNFKEGVRVSYNQTVYMHTSVNDPQLHLVLELVAVTRTEDGLTEETFGCGWGAHKLFRPAGSALDPSELTVALAKSIEIYHGSPRALLYLQGEIQGNTRLSKAANSQVLCSLLVHKALLNVVHLFPENIFVGQRDSVPGLVAGPKDPKTGVADVLKQPRLADAVQCSLEKIVVRFMPSIEAFEEEMCKQLLSEYVHRESVPSTGKGAQIVKRYLRVGVHNGWTYVSSPEEVQLSVDSEAVSVNKGASFKQGHRRTGSLGLLGMGSASSLVHRSRVEVEGLLADPQFHIIFTLVYEMTVPTADLDEAYSNKSRLAQPVYTVVIRWAAFCPFADHSQSVQSISLIGGPGINPDSVFVYRADKPTVGTTDMAGALSKLMGKTPGSNIRFEISLSKRGQSLLVERPVTVEVERDHQQQSLFSIQHDDADNLHDKPPMAQKRSSPGRASPYLQSQQQMGDGGPSSYPVVPYGMTPRGYLPVELQPVMAPLAQSHVTGQDLQEMPYSSTHLPILARVPGMHSGQSLSRAAYARLHTVGFPPILDRSGEAASVVEPADAVNFVPVKEEGDRRKINEIVLQFMAFAKVNPVDPHTDTKHSSTVFFTFQFYRFDQVTSERLMLGSLESDLTADKQSLPFILQRLDKDGSVLAGPPGYQVKYVVDPLYMCPGEGQLFVKYLAEQTLHIDVWDGDSLLLIGSCIVELRHLCRQGREAVQVSYELDIFSTEYVEREIVPSGDLTRNGSMQASDSTTVVKGRLHLRLGNVGHVPDTKLSKTNKTFKQIIAQEPLVNSFESQYKARTSKAQHLLDVSQELAQLIRARRTTSLEDGSMRGETKKKLARMQAVRQTETMSETTPITTIRREKEERSRDLRTIEMFRTHSKHDDILNLLNSSITAEQVVHASLGATEFFEFVLRNPYNCEHTVAIDWHDDDLAVITDPREWRHFKMINNVMTSLEENMFSNESKSGRPEVFLRAKESVHIPFRFLTFKADDKSTKSPNPFDPYKPLSQTAVSRRRDQQSRVIKVWFKTQEDRPIAILSIRVENQPHVVNQTFRLNHPEHTFIKKSIRLPPLHTIAEKPIGSPPIEQIFVRCSDPNVICDTKKMKPGEPHDIFFKVACAASPQVKQFNIAAYIDPYLSRPIQIWQLYVHAMNRVDVAAVAGQTSRFNLVLRGTQATRLAQCFSSHHDELLLEPRDPFLLPAGGLQEIAVGVRPSHVGTKCMYVNVVDIEHHQLVHAWLVSVISQAPVVTKTFELTLPVGGGKGSNQSVTYTNPYAARKRFVVRSSREDLVAVREGRLDLGAGETTKVRLVFAPRGVAGRAEIFVFVNDEDDKNDETFRVLATYKNM